MGALFVMNFAYATGIRILVRRVRFEVCSLCRDHLCDFSLHIGDGFQSKLSR